MPWKPLSQICREIEEIPFRPTPTAATELKGVLARRLGVNPSEISHAALLEVVRRGTPECLEILMRCYAREAKWLASGRRSPDGEREVIRPDHWAFLTIDIEHQIARDLDGKLVYADLKGAFGNDLTEEEWQSVEHQLAPSSPAPVSKTSAEDRNDERPELKQEVEPQEKPQATPEAQTAQGSKPLSETKLDRKVRAQAVLEEGRKRQGRNRHLSIRGIASGMVNNPDRKFQGWDEDTLRKILAGRYEPVSRLGLKGLAQG